MWNWIKNLFKKKPVASKPVEKNPIDEAIKVPKPVGPIGKLKIALIRGHGGWDSGAAGSGTNEVEYNTWVMNYVVNNARSDVRMFLGDSSVGAVLKSLTWVPDVSIQMHLNAYNGLAKGCEVLVVANDTKSYPIAEKFAEEFTKKFDRLKRRPEARGKKILASSDRGVTSLKASRFGVKILVEPFFVDNKSDFVPKEDYAKFLIDFVDSL